MISELDLKSLWSELDQYEKDLEAESKSLQEVWVTIAQLKEKNEKDAKDLLVLPDFTFVDPEKPIALNVGGQLFETTAGVLTRDPYSVLAAICRVHSPITPDSDGIIYFDRDWWLFRHILTYLRSNILPNELETLKELYKEASFYRLESLQRSIEGIPVDLVSGIAATWPGGSNGDKNQLGNLAR